MNGIVVLKGYKNGIKILMDPDAQFEDIRDGTYGTFQGGRGFLPRRQCRPLI
jgi:5S rRNA maturation endonuclease (ribonuclease M5)